MRSINGMKILKTIMKVESLLQEQPKVLINRQFLKLEPPIIIAKFGMSVTIYFMNKGKKQKRIL